MAPMLIQLVPQQENYNDCLAHQQNTNNCLANLRSSMHFIWNLYKAKYRYLWNVELQLLKWVWSAILSGSQYWTNLRLLDAHCHQPILLQSDFPQTGVLVWSRSDKGCAPAILAFYTCLSTYPLYLNRRIAPVALLRSCSPVLVAILIILKLTVLGVVLEEDEQVGQLLLTQPKVPHP